MEKKNEYPHLQQHQANERTFLAWIRTSVAFTAFGFVLEKFGIFIEKFSFVLNNMGIKHKMVDLEHHSEKIGISLMAIGVFLSVCSFVRYKITERQIMKETYYRSFILDVVVTLTLAYVGIIFIHYLSQ